ncbi:phosphatidate cytidylyltransferase [Desulfonema magnum]|uniref:Phosphatidate cytidylyltransferase n=1 Tax=Desulfonema magnum TaxID=45655 RepID=A0A975BNU1_9BACT|nr:phosphatidate cytidylyltransferase [Desulfonema magnum]QTA88957.1 Phosphatidate cytidylyltransferase [Desulfonema magnum]
MHLKRWITALTALPFLIFLIYKGGIFFAMLIGVVCLIGLCEYFRIVFNPKSKTISGLILVLAVFLGPLIIWAAYRNAYDLILGVVALNLILSALFSLSQFKSDPFILENVAKQVQGMTYIPLLLSFLVLIRNGTDGMTWIFFLLCIVFAGDIGAFYTGRRWGNHKLCPSVSPGKTIEGSLGGLVSNVGIGGIFKVFFLSSLSWGTSILFFLLVGAAGQVGDLFESEFKRFSGVKDSGVILPGHGGILDRIDALLFAAPVAYLFKEYIF